MLKKIYIKNIVLIDEIEIEIYNGLNISISISSIRTIKI